MKYLSLFSGIGGFELGIQQAYEDKISNQKQVSDEESLQNGRNNLLPTNEHPTCIGYSEIDKYAIQVYKKHFNHKNYGDCTKINERTLPDFELLVGGFPCQSFSIAGKRGGFKDTRGTLFFEIARIARKKQPRLLLLENVKGLLSHDKGRTFLTIITTLDELGYDCQWQVLNSKNFGVPQNRERVFIVGHLRGTSRPEVFPIGEDSKKTIVSGVHTGTLTSRYPASQREGTYIEENGNRGGEIKQINKPKHSNDRVYSDKGLSPTLNTMQGGNRQPFIKRQPLKFLDRNQKNIEGDYSFTVDTANTGGVRIDSTIRRLTPKECERLQGFPDDWTAEGTEGKISDTQRYKMAGNAISVPVIEAIVKRLLSCHKKVYCQ